MSTTLTPIKASKYLSKPDSDQPLRLTVFAGPETLVTKTGEESRLCVNLSVNYQSVTNLPYSSLHQLKLQLDAILDHDYTKFEE